MLRTSVARVKPKTQFHAVVCLVLYIFQIFTDYRVPEDAELGGCRALNQRRLSGIVKAHFC